MEQQAFQERFYAPSSIATWNVQIRKYMQFIEEFEFYFTPTPCSSQQAGSTLRDVAVAYAEK